MRYVTTSQPIIEAATHISARIIAHLEAGEKVLWLLSGGSGAAIAVATSLRLAGIDLSRLSITMTDERYGLPGHADENWQQIADAGFHLPGALSYRPLQGDDCLSTAAAWDNWLSTQLAAADYSIGIFGIGADGHTAGIKPHTSATRSTQTIDAFSGNDFERLTITFPVIARLSEIVVQASGDDKAAVIEQLLTGHGSLDELPAKSISSHPQSTLYTTVSQEDII